MHVSFHICVADDLLKLPEGQPNYTKTEASFLVFSHFFFSSFLGCATCFVYKKSIKINQPFSHFSRSFWLQPFPLRFLFHNFSLSASPSSSLSIFSFSIRYPSSSVHIFFDSSSLLFYFKPLSSSSSLTLTLLSVSNPSPFFSLTFPSSPCGSLSHVLSHPFPLLLYFNSLSSFLHYPFIISIFQFNFSSSLTLPPPFPPLTTPLPLPRPPRNKHQFKSCLPSLSRRPFGSRHSRRGRSVVTGTERAS